MDKTTKKKLQYLKQIIPNEIKFWKYAIAHWQRKSNRVTKLYSKPDVKTTVALASLYGIVNTAVGTIAYTDIKEYNSIGGAAITLFALCFLNALFFSMFFDPQKAFANDILDTATKVYTKDIIDNVDDTKSSLKDPESVKALTDHICNNLVESEQKEIATILKGINEPSIYNMKVAIQGIIAILKRHDQSHKEAILNMLGKTQGIVNETSTIYVK